MRFKEFISPSWKKFILPIIILVLSIGIFFISLNLVSEIGDQVCKIIDFQEEIQEIRKIGDEELLNQKINEFVDKRYKEYFQFKIGFIFISNKILVGIDPLYPAPCSLGVGNFCNYYSSQKHYDCINILVKDMPIVGTNTKGYNSINYLWLILNWVLLFIIWYLISCIIFLLYHKVKNRK